MKEVIIYRLLPVATLVQFAGSDAFPESHSDDGYSQMYRGNKDRETLTDGCDVGVELYVMGFSIQRARIDCDI